MLPQQQQQDNSSSNHNSTTTEESLKRKHSGEESVENDHQEFKKLKTSDSQNDECPYLDTINRKVLDFDFEKVCSETLSNTNVYCCLVDGKFFKGKGESTPAYIHSLNEDHHLFMSISNGKIYCLPDNYEVTDKSLDDIKFNLNPTFTEKDIEVLDSQLKKVTSISNGAVFTPGFVGLNSIKQSTDGINVAIQALSRIKPVRDFFLLDQKNLSKVKSRSVLLFSELLRKIWNPKNFKNHVNPLEFVQSILSNAKQFKLGESIDPVQFFTWLLNYLHGELTDNQPKQKSIISESFRGRVTITSTVIKRKKSSGSKEKQVEETTSQSTTPFMFLTLDVPSAPIFKDEYERNILPQVSLFRLLSKFNGEKETAIPLQDGNVEMRKYKIEKLPPYLVFHVKRFSKNFFFEEKNNTIVNFPLNNLDISEIAPEASGTHYNLVANICHDGSVYKIHVHNVAEGKWYEIQGLDVKEVIAEEVSISQSFLLIYAKQ